MYLMFAACLSVLLIIGFRLFWIVYNESGLNRHGWQQQLEVFMLVQLVTIGRDAELKTRMVSHFECVGCLRCGLWPK